jgi:Tfp pilus assembly protein PilE
MRRDRAGFSLIELITIMVIIGALAVIAMPRLHIARTRALEGSVRSDLRNMVVLQELHHGRFMSYASDPEQLSGFSASPGVMTEVLRADGRGWAGRAWHVSAPGFECRYETSALAEAGSGAAPIACQ